MFLVITCHTLWPELKSSSISVITPFILSIVSWSWPVSFLFFLLLLAFFLSLGLCIFISAWPWSSFVVRITYAFNIVFVLTLSVTVSLMSPKLVALSLGSLFIMSINFFMWISMFISSLNSSTKWFTVRVRKSSNFMKLLIIINPRFENKSETCIFLVMRWLLLRPKSTINCTHLISQSMNDEAVYKTALAKPGLLIIYTAIRFHPCVLIEGIYWN